MKKFESLSDIDAYTTSIDPLAFDLDARLVNLAAIVEQKRLEAAKGRAEYLASATGKEQARQIAELQALLDVAPLPVEPDFEWADQKPPSSVRGFVHDKAIIEMIKQNERWLSGQPEETPADIMTETRRMLK